MIGSNHGNLAAALVPELLSTHPFFMTSEPDVDDPACILPSQQLVSTISSEILNMYDKTFVFLYLSSMQLSAAPLYQRYFHHTCSVTIVTSMMPYLTLYPS